MGAAVGRRLPSSVVGAVRKHPPSNLCVGSPHSAGVRQQYPNVAVSRRQRVERGVGGPRDGVCLVW